MRQACFTDLYSEQKRIFEAIRGVSIGLDIQILICSRKMWYSFWIYSILE